MKKILLLAFLILLTACAPDRKRPAADSSSQDSTEKGLKGETRAEARARAKEEAATIHPSEKAFIAEAEEMFKKGNTLRELGYIFQADYYYSQAVVAVSSLRCALSEIIYVKQREARNAAEEEADRQSREETEEMLDGMDYEDGGLLEALFKLTDKLDEVSEQIEKKTVEWGLDEDSERLPVWDLLAAQSIVSPYPYFFEAISWDYKGKADKASRCYSYALMNPFFPSSPWDFSYWAEMDYTELQAISRRLLKKENEYRASLSLETFSTGSKRDPMSFDDGYLAAKAGELLEKDASDAGNASRLYELAVLADPFDPSNFAGAALLCGLAGDMKKAAFYLNEGLLIDPEHEGLLQLAKIWEGGTR